MNAPGEHLLVLSEAGTAELFANGVSLWASDSDPEVLEAVGTDALEDADVGEVLRYLMAEGLLTEDQAHACAVDSPEDGNGDDGDEDEDEDEDVEDEDEDEDELEDELQ